jgi:hypothetical protein
MNRRVRASKGLLTTGIALHCSQCGQDGTHSKRTAAFATRCGTVLCEACMDKKALQVDAALKTGANAKFTTLCRNAKLREIDVTIDLEFYTELLFNAPCHYCGDVVIHGGGGVDRIESNIGYIEGNVVPCCPTCNVMKNVMSTSDMINHMKKILKHQGVMQ